MDSEKRKLLHRKRGSGLLDNQQHETAVFLLGQGRSREDALKISGLTDEELDSLENNNMEFRLRLDYLLHADKFKGGPKKQPKTPDECLEYVKTTLWKLSRMSGTEGQRLKVRLQALKALADVALDERKNKPQQQEQVLASPALSRLTSLEADE